MSKRKPNTVQRVLYIVEGKGFRVYENLEDATKNVKMQNITDKELNAQVMKVKVVKYEQY